MDRVASAAVITLTSRICAARGNRFGSCVRAGLGECLRRSGARAVRLVSVAYECACASRCSISAVSDRQQLSFVRPYYAGAHRTRIPAEASSGRRLATTRDALQARARHSPTGVRDPAPTSGRFLVVVLRAVVSPADAGLCPSVGGSVVSRPAGRSATVCRATPQSAAIRSNRVFSLSLYQCRGAPGHGCVVETLVAGQHESFELRRAIAIATRVAVVL